MNVQQSVIYPIELERHAILSVQQVASKGRNEKRNNYRNRMERMKT
jgi:hypothetical protein